MTLAIYLIFYKLIIFETLMIFLELAIKLITGIFDLFFPKKTRTLIPLRLLPLKCINALITAPPIVNNTSAILFYY